MARSRALAFLVLSGAAALVAAGLVGWTIHRLDEELKIAERPPETVRVVVASRTIHPGRTITLDDVAYREMEPAFVPEPVYFDVGEVLGRVAAERIIAGDAVRRERLSAIEAGYDLVALVPEGQRAVSFDLGDASALDGFLDPGNFVDVLVTVPDPRGGQVTVTILQAKKVLAVDSRLGVDDDEHVGRDGLMHPQSVTVAVDPEEALRITHAFQSGALTLTLRNDVDITHAAVNGARVPDIIGRKAVEFEEVVPVRPHRPITPPPPPTVRICRGVHCVDQAP